MCGRTHHTLRGAARPVLSWICMSIYLPDLFYEIPLEYFLGWWGNEYTILGTPLRCFKSRHTGLMGQKYEIYLSSLVTQIDGQQDWILPIKCHNTLTVSHINYPNQTILSSKHARRDLLIFCYPHMPAAAKCLIRYLSRIGCLIRHQLMPETNLKQSQSKLNPTKPQTY
jgi:hypothetical protein